MLLADRMLRQSSATRLEELFQIPVRQFDFVRRGWSDSRSGTH
jgi:hypothetical protein